MSSLPRPLFLRLLEGLLVIAILAASGWLRLGDLDRFIAADELRWTCRSINFHAALADGRLADTFQVGHPGVITMWLGTLALPLDEAGRWRALAAETEGCTDLDKLDDAGMEGVMQSVAPLLFKARRGVALGTTVTLLALYLVLRIGVGLGAAPALGGLVLLAFDPFFLAHSRVLHVDAMTSVLGLVALAGLVAGEGPDGWRPRWLALSGAFAGLAMLNKSSGLLLGIFAIVWFAWQAWRGREWRGPAKGIAVWGAAAALAFFIAWPAMWVNHLGTVTGVLTKAQDEGASPHASGNFFLGQVVEDPGLLFYPVAAAFRMTPMGLIALVITVLLAVFGARIYRGKRSPEPMLTLNDEAAAIRLVRTLLVWAVFFGVVMTFGPKKFDRYLLPALVAIDLAGGVAVVTAFRGAMQRSDRLADRRYAGWMAFALFFGIFGLTQWEAARSSLPYSLMYYNPLLGGPEKAREVLLVGWGEGYDLAAGYLNSLPDAANLVASVRGVANFAPLFAGQTRSAAGFQPGRTDYVVLYQNEVQRRHNEELPAAYHSPPALDPVFVGEIGGIEMVWVYPNATVGPLEEALAASTQPGDVLVAGGETVLARHYAGPLDLVRYWGHWGEEDVAEALEKELPAGWTRAWVVRYPGYDPEAALNVLGRIAERGETRSLADGLVELTPFTREAP